MSVFISCSPEETHVADALELRLREASFVVARNLDPTRFGSDGRAETQSPIDTCSAFVLIWSTRADRSAHVYEEIMRAVAARRRLIACTLDDFVLPGFLEEIESVPVGEELERLGEVVTALRPSIDTQEGASALSRHSARQTLLATLRRRLGSFQVLYPGDERPAEEAVPLTLHEGIASTDSERNPAYTMLEAIETSRPNQHVVVLGHPGSGKTTTLLVAAHRLCMKGDGTEVPLYLKCKDFRPTRHTSLERFALDAIRQETNAEIAQQVEDSGLGTFGVTTLILDGFDELPAGSLASFRSIVDDFLSGDSATATLIVLSTRVETFRQEEAWFRGWRRFRIQPLEPERIEDFANQWFDSEEDAAAFLREVADPRLTELAERPFLLAMMCLVFEKDHELGANRSDLYRRAISYLELRRSDQTSERTLTLRATILRELALRGLQMGSVELDRWVCAGIAARELDDGEAEPAPQFSSIFAFLDEAAREVGVLQAAGSRYCFLHRSFQEYLTAERLRDDEGVLLEHCRVPRWEEPVRLHVGGLRGAQAQLAFLKRLWDLNHALALRALTELGRGAPGIVTQLLENSSPADRVRMLLEVRDSLADIDARMRRRLTIETTRPLLEAETDNEVLYWAIRLVEEVDPHDEYRTLWEAFGQHAPRLLDALLSDQRYRVEFVELSAGDFMMGDDAANDEIERPAHEVSIDAFAIARWQLTNLAYEFITGRSAADRPPYARQDDHPAVDLSWFDAYMAAYRVGCRLPTEAEWEYAARAGTSSDWSFGDDEAELPRYANYEGNPATQSAPWPVGSGLSNPWDLYDVHGNVWEWCQDWLAPYDAEPRRNPSGPPSGRQRVRRGGGHSYHARGCRSAFRWGNDPGYRFKDIGVRLARTITTATRRAR